MTQLSVPAIPKFPAHQPSKPMLARDADAMYWMSRYVERCEHVARMLLVNSNLLMDVGELAPTLQQRQWQSVLVVLRADSGFTSGDFAMGPRVASYMVSTRRILSACGTASPAPARTPAAFGKTSA